MTAAVMRPNGAFTYHKHEQLVQAMAGVDVTSTEEIGAIAMPMEQTIATMSADETSDLRVYGGLSTHWHLICKSCPRLSSQACFVPLQDDDSSDRSCLSSIVHSMRAWKASLFASSTEVADRGRWHSLDEQDSSTAQHQRSSLSRLSRCTIQVHGLAGTFHAQSPRSLCDSSLLLPQHH